MFNTLHLFTTLSLELISLFQSRVLIKLCAVARRGNLSGEMFKPDRTSKKRLLLPSNRSFH